MTGKCLLAAAAAAALLPALPAAGQDDAVEAQFTALARVQTDAVREGRFRGSLSNGGRSVETIRLQAGAAYLAAGACDADCKDLDLWVRGPDGAVVAQDSGEDDVPVARFSAPATGEYRLEILMATCEAEPCAYGLELYRDK